MIHHTLRYNTDWNSRAIYIFKKTKNAKNVRVLLAASKKSGFRGIMVKIAF